MLQYVGKMLVEQIRNKELLEESINKMKKENPAANLQLLEKTIGDLYLVENLANSGLDFIFKGGTSLVLLLNDLKQFSVDVDIITEKSSEKVLQCIENIVSNNDLFIRYEENIRENSASQRMELQHFKFFFKSATDESENVEIIRDSFISIANRELKYRKLLEVTYDDVLVDIEDFCKDIILLLHMEIGIIVVVQELF